MRIALICLLALVLVWSEPAVAASPTVSDRRGDQLVLDSSYDIVSADVAVRRGQLVASITMAAPIDLDSSKGRWMTLQAAVPACPNGLLTWGMSNTLDLPVSVGAASFLRCGDDDVPLGLQLVVSGRTITWRTPWKDVAPYLPPTGAYATRFRVYSDFGDPVTSSAGTRLTHLVDPGPPRLLDESVDSAFSSAWVRLS
jgi:hypothetical protein